MTCDEFSRCRLDVVGLQLQNTLEQRPFREQDVLSALKFAGARNEYIWIIS